MPKKMLRRTCELCGKVRRTTQQKEEPYTCGECEHEITRLFMKANGNIHYVTGIKQVVMMNAYQYRRLVRKPWWAFWR